MPKKPTYEGLEQKVKKLEKELNCLYTVFEIINRPGISLEQRLQEVVASVSQGWQYSEIASARLMFEGQVYVSDRFEGGPCRQAADLIVDGKKVGVIEVYYGEERPERDEGPFLRAERDLINAIARRIGIFVERRRADEARERVQKRLQKALTKILSGFLPICAKCKKIRDDAGNWVQIEAYIGDRTEVEFTHSICPKCAKELYPNFVKKTLTKSELLNDVS